MTTPLRGAATQNIIVIDDNPEIRQLVSRVLRREGFEVTAFADARGALDHLASVTTPVALLLTDGVMPGMLGGAVAAEARRLRPTLSVLLMSGHDAGMFKDVVGQPGCHFIAKPFVTEDLVARVRQIITLDYLAPLLAARTGH